jgi:hypothetical protein
MKTHHIGKIPNKLAHICQYALDMAYVSLTSMNEQLCKQRSRIYGVFRATRMNTEKGDVISVAPKYSDANWKHLWTNLHKAWISDAQWSTWYMVTHDLTPTNNRLAAINQSDNLMQHLRSR